MQPPISEGTLRELLSSTSVTSTVAVGQRGGFAIVVRYGEAQRTLASRRGAPRIFASLNTATSFLQRLGLKKFEVDATEFEPGRLRKPRPDRAEALRRTR